MRANGKIKLLLVSHGLSVGGLERMILTLCRSLDLKKYEITVLCLRELGDLAGEVEATGAKVILLPQKANGADYFSFIGIAKIIKQLKPDVIHTHNTQPLVEGVLGCLVACHLPRIIHTDHARQFPDKKRYMFAEWCASHFVYKIVGVSQQTTKNLRKFEKIPLKKLATIENGICVEDFQIEIDKSTKRKELGLPESGHIVGVVARLEPVKGVTYLLKAVPEILEKYPDTIFLIVGDGSEKNKLVQKCFDLGVDRNVFFVGVRHDVPQLLKLLDIYVLPSLSEGLPMGLLEAMAAGCPVVATRVGGVPAVFGGNENGFLIEPGSSDVLASTVMKLLNDFTTKDFIGHKTIQCIDKRLTSNAMVGSYVNLYER